MSRKAWQYSFARVAMLNKVLQMEWLKQLKSVVSQSGDWMSRIKVLAGLFFLSAVERLSMSLLAPTGPLAIFGVSWLLDASP